MVTIEITECTKCGRKFSNGFGYQSPLCPACQQKKRIEIELQKAKAAKEELKRKALAQLKARK